MNLSKLDEEYSIYIRNRDANEYGYCSCISCGKTYHWKKMHNGHFINRKHMSLRYNDINCNAQCVDCNIFDEGNFEGYRMGLIKKYGSDIIEKLYALKNQTLKLSQTEIDLMTKHFKKLNKINEIR